MNRLLILTASIFCTVWLSAQPAYLDKSLSPRERAEDLVSRLSIEEKVPLLMFESPAVERLGIKKYNWWNEALHGVGRHGNATVFPMPIAMAASFDTDLIEDVFTTVSDEARIKWNMLPSDPEGNMHYQCLTYWTPNINIFRDPRWGRGMETYGEDPYLTSQLGMAVVRGLQGPREDGYVKTMACAKHYAIHSGPEWSRHSFNAVASEKDLWETYLPAFKDLVQKTDVDQVMFAYNRMYGEPAGANKRFLRDILEDEWGFDGIVVSDCWAVEDFYNGHKWVKTQAEAAAAAMKAGMDLECGSDLWGIPDAIKQGLIKEEELDESLVKLFEFRYRMGEMDGESPWDDLPTDRLCSKEHADLALKIARKSIVLLENEGILPLDRNEKVAVMGPNAAELMVHWGNYNGYPLHTVSVIDGIRAKGVDVKYIPGVPYAAGATVSSALGEVTSHIVGEVAMKISYDPTDTDFDYDAFIKETEGYETVIFAGGIAPCLEGEDMPVRVPGFRGGDRETIELPEVQKKMVKALKDAGKKVVFVNLSGSAVALTDEAANSMAVVQAWYLGQEAGTAISDILYGDFNPSGKLPLTFYADDSQLADYESYDMKGRTYRYFEGKPLYPFGHGLSYTAFKFSKGRVVKAADGSMEFVASVKNTGKRDGETVLQLYVSKNNDEDGPAKTLRGYRRVAVKAGKTVEVRIPMDEETFLWWNPQTGRMNPMSGEYTLHYGETSDEACLKTIRFSYHE